MLAPFRAVRLIASRATGRPIRSRAWRCPCGGGGSPAAWPGYATNPVCPAGTGPRWAASSTTPSRDSPWCCRPSTTCRSTNAATPRTTRTPSSWSPGWPPASSGCWSSTSAPTSATRRSPAWAPRRTSTSWPSRDRRRSRAYLRAQHRGVRRPVPRGRRPSSGPIAGVTDRGYIATGASTGRFASAGRDGPGGRRLRLARGAARPGRRRLRPGDLEERHRRARHPRAGPALEGHRRALRHPLVRVRPGVDPRRPHRHRALVELLADSGREVAAYDNLGRRIVTLEGGRAVATGLSSLVGWLQDQRQGHVAVPYLDLWAFSADSHRATQ